MDPNLDPLRTRTRAVARANLWPSAFLVVMGCVLLAWSLKDDSQQNDAAKKFLAAPICALGASDTSDSDSAVCRLNAPMQVTDKYFQYAGRHNKYKRRYLSLRTYSGRTYTAKFYSWNALWASVIVGQVLWTQRWQDHVVWLSTNSTSAETMRFPRPSDHFYTGVAAIILIVFVMLFVLCKLKAAS